MLLLKSLMQDLDMLLNFHFQFISECKKVFENVESVYNKVNIIFDFQHHKVNFVLNFNHVSCLLYVNFCTLYIVNKTGIQCSLTYLDTSVPSQLSG